MSLFIQHNFKNALWLVLWIGTVVVCAPTEAQLARDEQTQASTPFEFSGRVTETSEAGFEVRNKAGEVISIGVDPSTDFAMRLSSPWFSGIHRKVAVDGRVQRNGQRERITYSLPDGQLYLLVEFRSIAQRDRIMKQPTWRINNYLISDAPIESGLPVGKELLLAGKLDLENSALIVGEKSWPIVLGHRSATLRGRSFKDIIAGQTVVLVTGNESGDTKTAETVLFMIR